MDIPLNNDDRYHAPGLAAAYQALTSLGTVHVVAPAKERSACSHSISLYRPISVERTDYGRFGTIHIVDGTPADCVRLAIAELIDRPIGLVVAGINRGANTGVDTFYSGTIAGAREATILGFPAMAVSQAIRDGIELNWSAAAKTTTKLIVQPQAQALPAAGFWRINLPSPIPPDTEQHIHRVEPAVETAPLSFERSERDGEPFAEFRYGKSYWERSVSEPSDFSVVRDGGIAITAVPLFGRF